MNPTASAFFSRQPSAPLPEKRPLRPFFTSADLEETRLRVGSVMKPDRLDVAGRAQRLDARMHHASFGDVSLSLLAYGAEVEIQPGPLEDFFLVQMPLAGRAQVDSGGQHSDSGPHEATVLSPSEATVMRWSADNQQLMVRVSRALVERTLALQLGRALDAPVRFQLGFGWRDNAMWMHLLGYLQEMMAQDIDVSQHRLVSQQVGQLVAATLLSVQPHSHSHASPARCNTVLPRHVRRVQDHIQAHAHEPLCADQLAEVAGVSVRSLYAGFKEFLGVSPMQYLKDLRLERARAELLGGSTHVAGVALRWGFGHLGRFSADYRARFGEYPSETVRRH
ncbi:MAG: AraC family transcriptional regulator [Pseudacidovorax sp.]|uniref:AraC family transcriptional regulator n=1 Tax=Pseudacidovorax sp. TaxID=1934311 RepID=UPI001B5B81C8|nr:AraC family transcriptional regulator [Pseudacidovorax sp.]MBP6896794.1 AraC family transcriptional regulator [Pseudacidovorax sp.]